MQTPAKNVISSLQSSSNKLSGILKTLSENTEESATAEDDPAVEDDSKEEKK